MIRALIRVPPLPLLLLLGGCAGGRAPAAATQPVAAVEPPLEDATAPLRAVEIALSYERSCARLEGGAVRCWGLGFDDEPHSWPTGVDGLAGALQIAVSSTHACARLDGGRVRCWGNNEGGALGDGTHAPARFPTADPGLTGVEDVAVGSDVSCARAGLEVFCWGDARLGAIEELRPALATPLAGARQLAFAGRHGLVLFADGTVGCVGQPAEAICGTTVGGRVPGLSNVVEIAVGRAHACARLSSGEVACWGANDRGQLGDGTHVRRDAPALIAGLANVVQLATADRTTCARLSNGAVSCWGANEFGQLGDGTTVDRTMPARVPGLLGVAQIAVGGSHACARLVDGAVQCWGSNAAGELGDRTRTNRAVRGPVLF